jgi:alpha-beta hydrolase superfamily lysophospholipase
MLSMRDGKKLHLTVFSPDGKPCRGSMLFVHGFGEHAGRYEDISRFFTQKGLACYVHDLRGHGNTPGKRGVVRSYDTLLDDVDEIRQLILAERSGPVVLYGHSMGGNIAISYLLGRNTQSIRCAVLSSPWLRISVPVPRPVVIALIKVSRLLPDLSLRSKLALHFLTHDEEIVKKTAEDSLYHNVMGIRLFDGVTNAGEAAIESAHRLKQPALLMTAGDDHIVSLAAIREFAGKTGENVVFHIWPDAYHELHNELNRGQILSYAWEFIEAQLNQKL